MMVPPYGENGVGPAHYFPRGPGPAGACKAEPDLLNDRHEHDWPVPGTEKDPRGDRRESEAGRGADRPTGPGRDRAGETAGGIPDHLVHQPGPAGGDPGHQTGAAGPLIM